MDSAQESFKSIPFRIYQHNTPPIQRLVRPSSDDGRHRVLEDLLQDSLKEKLNEG